MFDWNMSSVDWLVKVLIPEAYKTNNQANKKFLKRKNEHIHQKGTGSSNKS